MNIILITVIILITIATIYFAFKNIEFRKFLSGAFFVSGGIQLYLAFAKVSIPVLGTSIVQNSELGYTRGIAHLVLCLVCIYFGFIKKPTPSNK